MKTFAGALCLFVLGTAHAQKNAAPTRELVVQVFSTAPVEALKANSRNASMRLCDVCKRLPLPASLEIRRLKDFANKLLVGAERAQEVRFDGELQITLDAGRSARGAGKWVVKPAADGLHVTLAMPSERYVMAVLQSEAGANDGPEALKALAVVARSFALANPQRHGIEGLCDSTHCQAARMAAVPERIHDAVMATAGETLWYGKTRVDGYFTQNCGGEAANASEVWGGVPKPWLRAHADPYCQRQLSQWHASLTMENLSRSLRQQGFRAPPLIEAFRVASKDSSGRASKVEVSGKGQSLRLSASALRFAVNRELGWNQLRSDLYAAHVDHGSIVFDGRGYGHGVGLCQAGASEMARQGRNYRDILPFYFSGAEIRVNAGDHGWRSWQGDGWTVRGMQADSDFLRAGNTAWKTALSKWSSATNVRPVVTIAPDTELFRQMTNEPGWVLAATDGERVTLQPSAVVEARGGFEFLLRHEFLHVLVETEAGGNGPLWLREGLVEMLAGEKGNSMHIAPAQIESELRNAHSLRESQEAHHAAAALVSRLVARYGLGSVRGWLRSGVPTGVLTS